MSDGTPITVLIISRRMERERGGVLDYEEMRGYAFCDNAQAAPREWCLLRTSGSGGMKRELKPQRAETLDLAELEWILLEKRLRADGYSVTAEAGEWSPSPEKLRSLIQAQALDAAAQMHAGRRAAYSRAVRASVGIPA